MRPIDALGLLYRHIADIGSSPVRIDIFTVVEDRDAVIGRATVVARMIGVAALIRENALQCLIVIQCCHVLCSIEDQAQQAEEHGQPTDQ